MPYPAKRIHKNVQEIITLQIIKALKEGQIPWQKSWVDGLPTNLISQKPYSGLNLLLLGLFSSDNYFITFNQAIKARGAIKKGSSATPIIYWDLKEKKVDEGSEEEESIIYPVLKYYRVFGLSQTTGLEHLIPDKRDNKKRR